MQAHLAKITMIGSLRAYDHPGHIFVVVVVVVVTQVFGHRQGEVDVYIWHNILHTFISISLNSKVLCWIPQNNPDCFPFRQMDKFCGLLRYLQKSWILTDMVSIC